MLTVDIKELSHKNSELRARRLHRLKRSVSEQTYEINSVLIAKTMMREAISEAATKRDAG